MNKNSKKNSNVPNLRFPEFSGEWEERKLGDILTFFSTNSLSWDQLEYGKGNIYNLHYGLIHKGLPTQIELDKFSLPSIKKEFIPKNYTLCKEGDISFADASEDTNDVGKVVEFLDCNNKKVICGLHTIHARDNDNLTIIGFKGYAFSSIVFKNQIRRLSQGTKVFSISVKNFNEIFIGIPSHKEQKKIATLLKCIDERIQTQNKIIEQYKSLIKGISEKLTFQPDSKKIILKDILVERNERSTKNNQYDILSSTIKGLFLQREYFNREIASIDNIGYKIVRKFDIIISPQNLWMGNITFNEHFDFGLVSPSYKVFRIADGYHKYFISYLLRSYRALYSYLISSEQGASIVRRNLDIEAFNELTFAVPIYELQRKIGMTLKLLYDKLYLEKECLKSLYKHKSFFLQNLFI